MTEKKKNPKEDEYKPELSPELRKLVLEELEKNHELLHRLAD